MKLTIRHIVLYPVDQEKKPQVIRFEENKINVITGHSQKGKSALIHIIDYCLGSKECHIPLGVIRDKVDKFALEINLGDRLMFIARDSPNESKGNLYYEIYPNEQARTFQLDSWISNAYKFKTNRGELKTFLGELAGFENISEKDEASLSGFDAPASFRDTAAFLFQPQNIIANPTTIFFKTDTFEHLTRLKTLLPLVLGYKSYEILRMEKELEAMEKSLAEKERRQEDIKRQYENWQADIYQNYTLAVSLGLTNADINISTATVNELKAELARIVSSIRGGNFLQEGAAVRFSEKREELEQQRHDFLRDLDDAKIELYKIEQFDRSKEQYLNQVTTEIANRLKPVDWFLAQRGTNVCPFCESESEKAINDLLFLKEQQELNEIAFNEDISREFSFEQEKADFRRRIQNTERTILNLDANIAILENENREYHQRYQQIFEFSGKMANVLDGLDKISPSGILAQEIIQLTNHVTRKRASLRELQEKFDKKACLEKVTQSIDPYLRSLPIEHNQEHRVHLDPDKSVNIKVENLRTKNMVFLSKIGSGANHMGYHIATLLGLHEYFLKLPLSGKKNYIPSFLVFDQPSQVYFPKEFPARKQKEEAENIQQDEDIQNTTAIFSTCSHFMERTGKQIQIIILEHAPESTWDGIPNIHLVDEWRTYQEDGQTKFRALIPMEWFE